MKDYSAPPEFNPGLPQLDPAVRYHAIEQSNGRVTMEVVPDNFHGVSVLSVEMTCCACKTAKRISASWFAGTQWRSGKLFNDFLFEHKNCTGPVKQFAAEPKTVTEEEGRVFRGDE